MIIGDDAQKSDTNTKYAEDTKIEGSSSLLPWKKKKTGKRKRKNGPVRMSDVSSWQRIFRLTECRMQQHFDNQVNVEAIENE